MNTATEDQVMAYLRDRMAHLVAETGDTLPHLGIGFTENRLYFSVAIGPLGAKGNTLSEVINKAVEACSPAKRAEAMRREAAALLKRADALNQPKT